MLKIG